MLKRTVQALLFHCLAAVARGQAPSPFAGDWKLDPARSVLTDRMQVTSDGGSKYTFDFGGGPETIVVDGTDQSTPLQTDGTLSVASDSGGWKVVRKLRGRTTLTATWSLSAGGTLLTDHFASFNADGSAYQLNYVYERKAPGVGFAGTWVSKRLDAVNYVIDFQIEPLDGRGLAIIDSAMQFTGSMQFPDSLVRTLNDRAVELMKRNKAGGLADFVRLELSSDGRTLTITPPVTAAGDARSFVFDRMQTTGSHVARAPGWHY